ncbi:sialate O-acetylesterase-like isoform X1 [Branchiostoma floridae]|uniref:Sialate O-acetylesterase-like isoform X1 n=1 Tax=Branchiostoma floridae TaxID=7739 RepID=A0A9J7L9N9_BRAFL|nr:sialate O-acetylesterase-like isoform X1 [Branchiostoma floridae]
MQDTSEDEGTTDTLLQNQNEEIFIVESKGFTSGRLFRIAVAVAILVLVIVLVAVVVVSLVHHSAANSATNNTTAPGTFNWASYYGNHMVLQQGPHRAVLWGYGEVGATVNVSIDTSVSVFSSMVHEGENGRGVWKVALDPMPPGGPYRIQGVHDTNGTLQRNFLEDVMFGDVWVCSGQSNMEFTVSQAFNAQQAIAEAANFPNIRLFTVERMQSDKPLYDLDKILQHWSVASSDSVGGAAWKYFSAVCWFYGRELYNHLGYPIGLVATSYSGTPIETWSPPQVLEDCNITHNYREESDVLVDAGLVGWPSEHSVLWNAMIHPLLNMTIKGAIWYQGESNTRHPDTYSCSFPGMIDSWRKEWYMGTGGQTDRHFPFGFVQISTETPNVIKLGYPAIRWHQTADYGYVPNPAMPNVFMAVAVDLVDPDSPFGSIHPRYKEDVASRLVLGARAVAYNETDVVFQGPHPVSVDVDPERKTVRRDYPKSQNITVKSNDGFEVCCSRNLSQCDMTSQEWSPVPIVASTSYSITLQLSQDCWEDVTYIRYLWKQWPCDFKQCAVYSAESGLPEAPFFGCILEPDKKPPC